MWCLFAVRKSNPGFKNQQNDVYRWLNIVWYAVFNHQSLGVFIK